ncbi:MAG: hypothetical protein ACO1SX_17985, partial [Actinomycetota bacterium]
HPGARRAETGVGCGVSSGGRTTAGARTTRSDDCSARRGQISDAPATPTNTEANIAAGNAKGERMNAAHRSPALSEE